MAKIECPICDRDVTSTGTMGLGDAFKGHLMDTHRMTNLACVDMRAGVEPPMEVATYEERREVVVERPVGSERTTGMGRGESSTMERMESRGSEMVREPGESVREAGRRTESTMSSVGRRAETSRSTDYPAASTERVIEETAPRRELEEVRRTTPEFLIKCPFCNEVIRADDDDDLGDDLKDHWGDVHQIRPTIRAELGISRGR